MSAEEQPSGNAGCLATLVSVALAALVLSVAMFPEPHATAGVYLLVFVVTAFIVAIIGLPQYLLVLRFGWQNVWTAIAVGTLTGAVLPLALAIPAQIWGNAFAFALVGAIGGLAFYLTATAARNPARNVVLLLALSGISVALTPVAAIWLSPAPSSAAR